jgi:hypothetical protein
VVTPPIQSTGTSAPLLFTLRSVAEPSTCRQLQTTVTVVPWAYRQILLIIRKS